MQNKNSQQNNQPTNIRWKRLDLCALMNRNRNLLEWEWVCEPVTVCICVCVYEKQQQTNQFSYSIVVHPSSSSAHLAWFSTKAQCSNRSINPGEEVCASVRLCEWVCACVCVRVTTFWALTRPTTRFGDSLVTHCHTQRVVPSLQDCISLLLRTFRKILLESYKNQNDASIIAQHTHTHIDTHVRTHTPSHTHIFVNI